jgi:multifunctional 2-oxoglutarate metabolism enzyme
MRPLMAVAVIPPSPARPNRGPFPSFPLPKPLAKCDVRDDWGYGTAPAPGEGVALFSAVHYLAERKRAVTAVSPQSPNTPSATTDQATGSPGVGSRNGPTAGFGANEWLVDEIYQQYLKDPHSVDRAWWDFFADYKPGTSAAAEQGTEQSAPTAQPDAPAPARPAATTGTVNAQASGRPSACAS